MQFIVVKKNPKIKIIFNANINEKLMPRNKHMICKNMYNPCVSRA